MKILAQNPIKLQYKINWIQMQMHINLNTIWALFECNCSTKRVRLSLIVLDWNFTRWGHWKSGDFRFKGFLWETAWIRSKDSPFNIVLLLAFLCLSECFSVSVMPPFYLMLPPPYAASYCHRNEAFAKDSERNCLRKCTFITLSRSICKDDRVHHCTNLQQQQQHRQKLQEFYVKDAG